MYDFREKMPTERTRGPRRRRRRSSRSVSPPSAYRLSFQERFGWVVLIAYLVALTVALLLPEEYLPSWLEGRPGMFQSRIGNDKVAHVIDTGRARVDSSCAAEAAEVCPQRAIVEVDE